MCSSDLPLSRDPAATMSQLRFWLQFAALGKVTLGSCLARGAGLGGPMGTAGNSQAGGGGRAPPACSVWLFFGSEGDPAGVF